MKNLTLALLLIILGNTLQVHAQNENYIIFYTDVEMKNESATYRVLSEIIPIKSKYCVGESSLAQRILLGYSGEDAEHISSIFGNILDEWEAFILDKRSGTNKANKRTRGLLITNLKIAKKKWKTLKKELKSCSVVKSFNEHSCD